MNYVVRCLGMVFLIFGVIIFWADVILVAHSEVLTGKYNILTAIIDNNLSAIPDLTSVECSRALKNLRDSSLSGSFNLTYSACVELDYSEMNKVPGERRRANKE